MALERIAGKTANEIDERYGSANFVKRSARKIFPDHWSFMLGEIALYSFIILLLTGTFLTLWFKPSSGIVVYDGSYVPLEGLEMSEAYASTLEISFDVRGGLLIRQIHHWAALIFVAAMVVHMPRVFFTGAFRKPREANWIIGVILLTLSFIEGLAGYSLPDDLLSGTGLRITEGVLLSLPVVGTYVSYFLFGGQFPGEDIIPRLFTVHVLLIPGIFLALITVHLMLVWYQKHTQYPLPGRTEKNAVGYPFFPVYTAKAGGFFFITFGVTTLLSAFVADQPGLAVRALQPWGDLCRLAAGLVHGLPRGRAADVPELGDPAVRLHDPVERHRPGADHPRPDVHPDWRCTRSSNAGSPGTTRSTTCSTGRATPRPAPVSVCWRSRPG